MITIRNEQQIPIDTTALKNDAKKILQFLKYSTYDLGILLITSSHMHKLNKQYRNHDKPTDILSFPYHPDIKAGEKIIAQTKEEKNLGDLVICPEYVEQDLARWNQSFQERIKVLLVHGICHLLGYDHIKDTDYEIMHQKEMEILAMLSSK